MDILTSCTFELADIEIIHHKSENEEKLGTFNCDKCSLFFLEKEKLAEHKKKHGDQAIVKCKYCNKTISSTSENRECYVNRKCETCEYKCSKCPQRFLRHSSLMNHERKHSSPKRKRTVNSDKKINGTTAENIALPKALKRKRIETDISEERKKEGKRRKSTKNSPQKKVNNDAKAQTTLDVENRRSKIPKRMSSKLTKSAEEEEEHFELANATKRSTPKSNKLLDEKSSDNKSKQDIIGINSQTVSQNPNLSNNDNVVNYKPFSCHVCGDTFASDSALLDHIKTHGESAAKSFKCKFCSDEFDDVYKMQYHLAICPLAEDELESSLKQVIPLNIPKKYSGSMSSPRKRGRPKRVQELPSDQEGNDDESTPSSKRGKRKQRNSEVKDSKEMLQISSGPSLPKKPKKLQHKELISGAEGNKDDSVFDDVTVSEPINYRNKMHQCPFPRCDFKFTREKALLCHMRNHSDDFDDSLKCHKCDIPFDDIHTLRQHINICKGIKEERDEDFSRAGCFDTSPNRSIVKVKKDFLCIQCGRSYQNQEKLDRHLESCGSKFVCRICKDDFHNQHLLDEHYASKHPSYTAYHCYICEEDFISELFLKIHQSDEHRINENTQTVGDSFRKSLPNLPPRRSVQETNSNDDLDNAKFHIKNITSSSVNLVSSRCDNKIRTSSVTTKTGSCINSSRVCRCPVCLVGFDSKFNMRVHFKEKHVSENNSTFSCEICEVNMPCAGMMIYHLELHSTNLLSLNRFSKLVACVKQSRGNEVKRSEVEIKLEEVDEDKTSSPIKETIYTHAVKKQPTKKVHTPTKTDEIKSNDLQNIKSKSRVGLIENQNYPLIESVSVKKRKLNFKTKSTDEKQILHDLDKSKPLIDCSNDKTELKIRNQNQIEKPTRSLRSRGNVKYPLQEKTSFFRQKVKLEKVSDEETCLETTALNDTILEMDNSNAFKEPEFKRSGRINKRVWQRKLRQLKKKKQNESSCFEKDTKTSVHTNPAKSIYSEELVKPKLSLITENEKDLAIIDNNILNPPIAEMNINSIQLKQLHNTDIKNSNVNIDNELKDKQLGKAALSHTENSDTVSLSDNIKVIEDINSDSSVKTDLDRNSVCRSKEISGQLVTQSSDQDGDKMIKGPLVTTEKSNELKAFKHVLLEDSVHMSGSEVSSETRNIDLDCENLQTGRKEPVSEESRASTISTAGGSEGICCTMCTETFYNQDELLDHLSSHI